MVEQRRRAVFNWSGGKDSALALQTVLREDRYEVVSLLTTVDASNDRSSMHGIPAELLRMQADSIGLPIRIVPTGKGIEDYERAMAEAVGDFVAREPNILSSEIFFCRTCARTGSVSWSRMA